MKWLLVLSLLLPAATAAQQTRPSALESDPKGWKDIFPGKDLKGWKRLSIPPTNPVNPQNQWSVDAGQRLLICDGTGGHEWLRYDRELRDAIFHVEWRFVPKPEGKGYNSGAYIRNSADASIWHQAQVGGGAGGFWFGDTPVAGKVQRVNLRDQLKENRVKPAGEWNTYELTARGKELSLWVNGAITSEFRECEMPAGYLGLEAEGWRIEFRNLRLKMLK